MFALRTPAVVATFLAETTENDPVKLFCLYAQYLLRTAGAWELPVRLERVREKHGFHRRGAPLTQRGFLLGDIVVVNIDDPTLVQRFSEAHELMEALFCALTDEHPFRFSVSKQALRKQKERYCEMGAAELLMPAALVFPEVQGKSLCFSEGRKLAELCQTSLTAAIRRLLEADLWPGIFMHLREAHKKNEVVPSQVGQQVLWGKPEEWDPPAELRVWKTWQSPQSKIFVCHNESVARETTVYQTLTDGIVGQVRTGYDRLEMENLKGCYYTESMLVNMSKKPTVMTLIHL